MAKIDIHTLAEVLNISTSTVSRAFRNTNDINPETRKRILEKAAELNYQPNHYASNLREQKSKTIAVIIPELANNYFSQIIQGVEKVAKTAGYHILIFVTDDDIQKEREFMRSLSNGRVDGVVMSASGEATDHSYLNNIESFGFPLILFDRIYEEVGVPKIITDDYNSSYHATQHLIDNGCERIAYLVVNKEQSIGKTRMQGYVDALKKNRIPIRKRLIVDCTNSYEENAVIIEHMIEVNHPDGILASVERLAFSTYQVCQSMKLQIPQDIKIAAFSSLEIASLLNPPLTTIKQPAIKIGEKAASLLLEKLADENPKQTHQEFVLESELMIRDSSLKGSY
ncbi:LacI family DNA-binding transcriptional regulator [Sphingobacterium hungaricum]|uniref:LacI family transcriptional regulator n=1 Tax=Sphingobacterium hungaricum TaxID=2082723 RepID=A0A928UYA9_9SPHI|nr:LacI family DNA-binding transcriptional regulator [Sphingobacterium hungaricum]MBE8713334.1 LacI family transcriptional regulator [Sphingobacterium hungaricum]